MYLCLMYICPDVSKSGGGDVPMSDVSKSAPSQWPRGQRMSMSIQHLADRFTFQKPSE